MTEIHSVFKSKRTPGSGHGLPLGLVNHSCMVETRQESQTNFKPKLHILLRRFTNFSATERQDRIFALLSLAGDMKLVNDCIDYSMPIEDF